MRYVISYDLGTGGLKSGIFNENGKSVGFVFYPYDTYYPKTDWHEQRPYDWWNAVCASTKELLKDAGIEPSSVIAAAASGHSLVCIPIGQNGEILLVQVPIWSDRRATEEVAEFFRAVDYKTWYMTTGNGDPPETYSVFKLMWLKKQCPELFAKIKTVIGSKDFINYMLTGNLATDYSYASGSGVFDLQRWKYCDSYISASGIPRGVFPEPIDSYGFVGTVTARAAEMCGLCEGTKVFCGGVDNSCMALGTMGIGNGKAYTSIGSSAWISVSSDKPILDGEKLPFIFAHVEKGYYTSGVSIFAAANTYRWARDTFCKDISEDWYVKMDSLAEQSPVGANGIMFNPSMAGGSSQEPSRELQGSFFGLKLSNTRSDILRAVLEGVALSLKCYCLSVFDNITELDDTMIICGGGAKSNLWMQIFADIYNKKVVVTNAEQDAALLGAAAIAARGAGLWKDYTMLEKVSEVCRVFYPDEANSKRYAVIAERFKKWVNCIAEIHEYIKNEGR